MNTLKKWMRSLDVDGEAYPLLSGFSFGRANLDLHTFTHYSVVI
jgi:hypothetical protein